MMFSFLRKKKLRKSTEVQSSLPSNENKENHQLIPSSVSIVSSGPAEQTPNVGQIHVDTRHISSDKLQLIYDSNESSPRNGCHSSSHQSCPTASHLAPNDLNRVLTSGYLNGEKNMGYMKRGTGDHIAASSPKSSQFHRPVGFSYNRTQPFAVSNQRKGMKALVTGQTKVRKVHCSHTSSPVPIATADPLSAVEKEPIVLSRYSGGFIPDPSAPKKIESLDWPAPIAIQAIPELMRTRRIQSGSQSDSTETLSNPEEESQHDEVSKLKDSSSMAHALLEKVVTRQVPLDPWKASRSPSAAVEPPQRCRFESPKFASPSRRVYTHSSSTTHADDSLAILSAISNASKGINLSRDTPQVLRHEYGRDIQRSCDLESAIHSCYSTEADQNKSVKTVDGRFGHTDMDSRHEPSTHSAPAQMTNLKLYSYDELKVRFNKRLPSDVGRDHLERHLSDQEFQRVFQLKRSEFYRLPEWRRVDLKKRLRLF